MTYYIISYMSIIYKKIRYKKKDYAVIELNYKNNSLPTIIDWEYFKRIKDLNKKWKCQKNGFVLCSHRYNSKLQHVYMHELIMSFRNEKNKKKFTDPIIHINRIGLDNRESNLKYLTNCKINYKKKKRTVKLPKGCNIEPNEIPTYIWYLKENGSHGSRFSVEVGDTKWKTTSSKKLSLRYKLEEAKKFLRELKLKQPILFNRNSMNGEFNTNGKINLKEYYKIISKAGYDNIILEDTNNLTDSYLKKSNKLIQQSEKKLLNNCKIIKKQKKRRLLNNIPYGCNIVADDLPKYTYYRQKTEKRGDYFVVENHPNQEKRTWQTTSSKKVSTVNKYNDLLEYLKNLEN
jgi:hypothetical protein